MTLGSVRKHASPRSWSGHNSAARSPAPSSSFLFSGSSFALVTERLREKGATPAEIAKTTSRRGAEIIAQGLLFRIQEYALGYRWSPWTDLLRVDVLNILGLSMMLMGALSSNSADHSPVNASRACDNP